MRRAATAAFYWLIDKLSDRPVPRNVSDFRLVDRRAYAALNAMRERHRMMRTMWRWIGFPSVGVHPSVRRATAAIDLRVFSQR